MSIIFHDPYKYPDSPVLKNKFGIKDEETLAKVEADIACNVIRDISTTPISGKFDFEHLCKFHERIFDDVYEWAGESRTIAIEKHEKALGGLSVEYAQPKNIESEASGVLGRMNNVKWDTLNPEEKAKQFSDHMAELWKVHPFRDGNTRATITFMCQFAETKGIALDNALFENNAAYMRNALVAASAVYSDVDLRKPEYLYTIIKDSMERGANIQEQQNDNQTDRAPRGNHSSMADWKRDISAMKDKDKARDKGIDAKKAFDVGHNVKSKDNR